MKEMILAGGLLLNSMMHPIQYIYMFTVSYNFKTSITKPLTDTG